MRLAEVSAALDKIRRRRRTRSRPIRSAVTPFHSYRTAARAAIAAVTVAFAARAAFAAEAAQSRLGPNGFGRVVYGASPAQLSAAGIHFTVSAPPRGSTCHYLTLASSPGLRFLVEDGNVRRAEVSTTGITTVDGFRVGDAAVKVTRFYGTRAASRPAKYDASASVLIIETGKYRTLFNLHGGRVRAIYSGVKPQIEYVEGCS